MRRFLTIAGAIIAVAAGLGLFFWLRENRREHHMADGSVMRVEKVAFGKQEHIKVGRIIDRLKAMLPAAIQKKFSSRKLTANRGSWYENTVMHTNDDALYIYITRRDPMSSDFHSVDCRYAQLIDEDGCCFLSTQAGGWDDGLIAVPGGGGRLGMSPYSVGWFRFEAFPRREKKFRLRLYDTPQSFNPKPTTPTAFAEFMVVNPAPAPRATNWPATPLPVTQTQGTVSFSLTKVAIGTNITPYQYPYGGTRRVDADYEVVEDGRRSTNWDAMETELYDSSGNFVSLGYGLGRYLCPRESAWKLRVKFFGSEKSAAASNAVWTLRAWVPAPGKFTLLDGSQELQGVSVKTVTFGGAGIFTYSNGVPLEASAPEEPVTQESTRVIAWPQNWAGRGSANKATHEVKVKSPHLAVEVGDLNDDQRLTVRAVDDQGREFYGRQLGKFAYHYRGIYRLAPSNTVDHINYMDKWYDFEGQFVVLDLPADANTVDLSFCVHTCRTVEFIFKPPGK